MAKKVTAVMDKVVGLIVEDDRMSDGGIVIPDVAVNLPQLTCKIMSIGDDVDCVNVGDIIYCHRNAGMDILIDTKPMKVLKDEEIYAIVSEEKEVTTPDEE